DGLEGVDDGDVLAVDLTGHRRPGVQEDTREVEAGGSHQHAGQRLVAPGQQHGAVEALGHHHGLDGVGDHLAAHQGEVHAFVTHGDAAGGGDRAELEREAAASVHAVLHGLGQPVQRQVAGGDLVPAGRHTDLRLDPVVVTHPDGPEHAACGRLLQTVGDVAG